MRKLVAISSYFFIVTAFVSCKTGYLPSAVQFQDYRVANKEVISNNLSVMLKPYSDSVNKSMNDVIATAGMNLEKMQPEGTLNNVMADALLNMAIKKYQTKVDASFLNYGGIRLPSLREGNITRGKIFEISPFDNVIVLLNVDGGVLQQFLNIIAKRGGWPCAGIQFQIKNNVATNVEINGQPMQPNNRYTIATIDYVANGGDDCDMLKGLPQQNNGYLFRDAVITYFANQQQQGKLIVSSLQNRVSNAQ